METYTENEIKEWFNKMKEKYPNSILFEQLESIEFMMFDKSSSTIDCLERIKEKD